MQIFIRRPSDDKLKSLLNKYQDDPLTYNESGVSKSWTLDMFENLPTSKVVGEDLWKFSRERLGSGLSDFQLVKKAMRDGKCFDLTWVNCFAERPFEVGDTYCLYARAFRLWSLNFCRVVYLEDEENERESIFSIGIGTLPKHAAVGEERLSVVWDRVTDEVDFLIGSFSRPATFVSKIFASYLRNRQDIFAIDSVVRLRRYLHENRNAANHQ